MDRDPTEGELEIIREMHRMIEADRAEIRRLTNRDHRHRAKAERLAKALDGVTAAYDEAQDRGLITPELHDRLGGAVIDATKAVWQHNRDVHRETKP